MPSGSILLCCLLSVVLIQVLEVLAFLFMLPLRCHFKFAVLSVFFVSSCLLQLSELHFSLLSISL